jgi:uncharacterized Zn finger protein
VTARGFPAFPPRPGRRGRSWWARAFLAALEDAALDATVLRAGRRFAGSGRLGPVTIAPGRASAGADDPDDGPVDVVLHLPVLDDAAWERFSARIAAEAGHLAALLDGEVPRALVDSADAAGVDLLPGVGELESACSCPDVGDPCVHSAALAHQVAWLLDDDPFLLLLLRGRDRTELLDALAAPVPAAPVPAVPAPAVADPLPATVPRVPAPGPFVLLPVPPPPGLPPEDLPRIAARAAARARALLAAPPPR